jgi:hypothetical protein
MAKMILIDEFHVAIRAPAGLPDATYLGARRTLNTKQLHDRLRRAVDEVFRRYLSLKSVKFSITF